ncbi:hypothetical protein JCM1393_19780 [Clostridium carnis]
MNLKDKNLHMIPLCITSLILTFVVSNKVKPFLIVASIAFIIATISILLENKKNNNSIKK